MASQHTFKRFMKESGFKVLALARLSQCEYSIMLYLLNCAVSGLDQDALVKIGVMAEYVSSLENCELASYLVI